MRLVEVMVQGYRVRAGHLPGGLAETFSERLFGGPFLAEVVFTKSIDNWTTVLAPVSPVLCRSHA